MTAPLSISWLVEALIASTVLMLVVLLLRRPVRQAFGAGVAYALWLLPVLRLALPPLPAAWHEAAVAPVLRATEQMTLLLVEPAGETAAVAAAPSYGWLLPALAILWVVGAGAFLLWHTLAHHRFCRRMLDHAASNARLGGVHIIETSAATGPLAFGIWRRYVAFPHDFAERFEPEERDLALAHELGHHARGDLIANWIALFVLALHWFNPVAWRAFRAFRADQEIANDARVLAGMNPMRRHTYACAILKAAHGGAVSAACHLHTIDDLKGRLKMLTTTKTSRARLVAGSGVLSLCLVAGLGLTASGTAAAAKVRSTVEHATGVELASLDQAIAAPAPPAPPAAEPATPAAPAVAVLPPPPAARRGGEHIEGVDVAGPGLPPPAVPHPPHTPSVIVTRDGARTITLPSDDGHAKVIRIIRRDKHGATSTEAFADMPDIRSENCASRGGSGMATSKMVIDETKGGKRRIVVCVDRINKVAAEGAAVAANSKDVERNAYLHALDGLRSARARMMASTDMAADDRKAALDGIDTAIAEIEGDLAKVR